MEKEVEEKMSELVEGAMSLYNTIESEITDNSPEYKDGETKLKEILNDEDPLFVPNDDPVTAMLFHYASVGYSLAGIKYLDMILKNPTIATSVFGYMMQLLNVWGNDLMLYEERYGPLESNKVEEKELKGISES